MRFIFALLLVACANAPLVAAPINTGTVDPPAPIPIARRRFANSGPDPKADYLRFEDANADGKSAFGKTLLARLRRGDTSEDKITAFSCEAKGSGNFAYLNYADEDREFVRAMPKLLVNFKSPCPRVLFKITGFAPYSRTLRGEILTIFDVAPQEPTSPSPGSDYASLDEVLIDGHRKYEGKIVEFAARRTDTKNTFVNVSECNNTNGYMKVTFTPDQQDAVKRISADYNHCTPIRVKLAAPHEHIKQFLQGELLEVK